MGTERRIFNLPSGLSAVLTERDLEIIETLTLRVRTLSGSQLARTWWDGSTAADRAALRRMRKLEVMGKVHVYSLLAHPEILLESPLVSWVPGNSEPEFGAIAYQCTTRWTEPHVERMAVIASRSSGREFGGWGGRFPRRSERTHDLHVAAVYLRKRAESPELVRHWRSEEVIRMRRSAKGKSDVAKLPDAIITRPRRTAIDFAGRYSADRLRSFHAFCADQGLRYELW